MKNRSPQAFCLVSFAALVINYYLRAPTSASITGAGIGVIATTWGWMLMAVLTRRDRRTLAWLLLTAAVGCFLAGALFNFIYSYFHGGHFPFPGPADIAFLVLY